MFLALGGGRAIAKEWRQPFFGAGFVLRCEQSEHGKTNFAKYSFFCLLDFSNFLRIFSKVFR
jgi:hypothetical protein